MGSRTKEITLYKQEGETYVHLYAQIDKDGDLRVCGHDIGAAPQEWWGHDDYEYTVTVSKKHKDRLLLALIAALYKDNPSAVSEFRDFAKDHDIPYGWFSWP
ncbi:MAG: hypothetical protein ACE5G0_03975 [Rhodothermales bacterium]